MRTILCTLVLLLGMSTPARAIDIERVERVVDLLVQSGLRQELAVGVRRRGEAAGNADAGIGELRDHFAKRRVLAADLVDVGHAQFFEGDDKLFHDSSFGLEDQK